MNAKKRGTGPKTPQGKRRSSLNAMKHGLTAKSPHGLEQLAEELHVDSELIHERMRMHYRPADPLEHELVKRIADCLYRLERARAMEKRITLRRPDALRPTASYERIIRHERSIDVHLYRAIAALDKKRASDNKKTHKTNSATLNRL
ncbi:MAG: hypothetical protein ACYC64_18660 [Armatimonadota bacterium]